MVTYLGSAPARRELDTAENGLTTFPEPAGESDEVARLRFVARLRMLWQQRRFLLAAAALVALLGVLAAFILPKKYESTTQLMPPDSQSTSGMALLAALGSKGAGGLSSLAGDFLGVKSNGALFVGVLRSRTVQDRIVDRFDLKHVYGVKLDKSARTILSNHTVINEDRKSGIISITVTERDPQRAAGIARAYVEELDRLVSQLSTSSAHRERVFLEQRLAAVKKELDDATKNLSQFQSKTTTLDPRDQGRAMMDAAATLMGQLIAAESELKGLEEIYSPENVRIRSVQARIAELRSALDKIGGPGTAKGANFESMYPTIRQLPLLGATYADYYRSAKVQEAVFETLTQEYELAKVQEAKETPSVKVLDEAMVPEKYSFPPRFLIIVLAPFFGLAAAIVFCLGRATWDEVDNSDPRKAFANEVWQSIGGRLHRPASESSALDQRPS